ncbi:MAG: PucR family transcriptional regulator [Streptosporangiaceae bacterium]
MADRRPAADGPAEEVAGQNAVSRETSVLRELVTIYRHLSGLALQNAEISTVTRLLAERTSSTVAVVSRTMEVWAAAAPRAAAEDAGDFVRDVVLNPRLSRALSATAQTRRSLRLPDPSQNMSVVVAPILVGEEVPAYLMAVDTGEGRADDISLLVSEHAATICGVILSRERVVAAAAGRVRSDLVEGLLLGRGRENGEADRWARHLGYDSGRDHRVLSVAFGGPKNRAGDGAEGGPERDTGDVDSSRHRRVSAVERFFATREPETITSVRDSEVVVVVPEPVGRSTPLLEPRRLAEACAARVAEQLPGTVMTVGIGDTCREPGEIARSYAEARRTVDAARRLGRLGQTVAFEDLGIHRLLLQVPELGELRRFAEEVLGRLSAYEREHNSEYLMTLSWYFRENNSPQRVSRRLHVHPNTVAYRVRRSEEITGLTFDRYRDRLMAQVALEILDALGEGS